MFSIVICCYNGSSTIIRTLESISKLKLNGFKFEVILVDNNSTDNTSVIAKDVWTKMSSKFCLRIISEARPGQVFARIKGVEESIGDYILFCDDDNWLHVDYLINANQILKENSKIGILGGWSEAIFEVPAPNWFKNVSNCYAVGGNPNQYLKSVDYVWGAGMIIRAELASRIFSQKFLNLGRCGDILTSGDDVEICSKAKYFGSLVLKSDKLFFHHFITKERLNWNYITKLYIGFGYSATKEAFIAYRSSHKYWFLQIYRSIALSLKNPIAFCYFLLKSEGKIESLKFYSMVGNFKYLIKRA